MSVTININDISDRYKRMELVAVKVREAGARATYTVRAAPGWDAFKVSTIEYDGVSLGWLCDGTDGGHGAPSRLHEFEGDPLLAVRVETIRRIGHYYSQPKTDERVLERPVVVAIPTLSLLSIVEQEG